MTESAQLDELAGHIAVAEGLSSLRSAPMRIWLCVLGVLSIAQPVRAERLPLRNYRSTDGLPHDRIKSIFRDSRGFLWFCTVEGLGRFDGHRFERYGIVDGLPSPSINDIIEASAGVYWIASNGGGISRFDADRRTFTSVRLAEAYLSNRVNTIRLDHNGRLWAGADAGLFWLDPQMSSTVPHREVLPAESGIGVTRLLIGSDGSLWIGSPRGLTRLVPGRAFRVYRVDIDGRWPVRALGEGSEGRLWVAGDRGLFVCRPERGDPPTSGRVELAVRHASSLAAVDPEAGKALLLDGAGPSGALLVRSDGTLRIGTTSGALLEFDGARFRHNDLAHGLGDSDVLALEEDAEQNLWIGTYSAGAFRLARFGMVTYGTADGLPNSAVAGLIEDRRGRLVAATYDGALSRFASSRFAPLGLAFLAPQGFTGEIWQQFVFQSRTGDWWLRTERGAFHLRAIEDVPSAVIEDFGLEHALPHRAVERIYEDRFGRVWIGLKPQSHGDSLALWDARKGLQLFGVDDGLPSSGWPSTFGEDRAGDLWIGFSEGGGLARYRSGRFDAWTTADGVPAGTARAILRDRRDRLWVAFDAGGLCRITQEPDGRPRFEPWTAAQGLASNNTRALAEDASGRIYVGTDLGVDRLDADARTIRHYTTSAVPASHEVEVALAAHDGTLWVGTHSGLSRLSQNLTARRCRR